MALSNPIKYRIPSVTSDLTLRTSYAGRTIEWVSNTPSVITNSGVVTRPVDDDAAVVMTYTLKKGETVLDTGDVNYTVLKVPEAATPTTYEEDFETATELPTGTNYGAGTFVGTSGLTWTYSQAQTSGIYSISGIGVLLRRASDSYLEVTIPTGLSSFSFEWRKGYTGGDTRRVQVLINGTEVYDSTSITVGSGEQSFAYTVNLINLSYTGSTTIKIKIWGTSTSNSHIVIDNAVITNNPE